MCFRQVCNVLTYKYQTPESHATTFWDCICNKNKCNNKKIKNTMTNVSIGKIFCFPYITCFFSVVTDDTFNNNLMIFASRVLKLTHAPLYFYSKAFKHTHTHTHTHTQIPTSGLLYNQATRYKHILWAVFQRVHLSKGAS